MELADADISRLSAEEFFHKFWHPLASARARVDSLARAVGPEQVADIRRDLDMMNTMLQRAQTNNWLLAHDGYARMTLVHVDQLTREIQEAVMAISILADHPEAARFEFDRHSFEHAAPQVWTDARLFQAALGNILDNARKYSFDGTAVHITARRGKDRCLHIEVANIGIALRADDAERCRQRGWRSETALRHTDKGLGVGLWLTDRILRTIDAQLLIMPTDAAGITRFTISLPTDRPRREG